MSESSRPSSTPRRRGTTSNGRGDDRTPTGLSHKTVDRLAWIITGIWTGSMILHAFDVGYDPPVSIHALMMIVAGAAFSTNLIKPRNGAHNELEG